MRVRACLDLFPEPAGTWFILPERKMRFSDTRKEHPWILVRDWSARTAFGHGCVRTSKPGDEGIEHLRHQEGHEPYCGLDRKGRVLPETCRQIRRGALEDHQSYRSCCEGESSDLLDRLVGQIRPL